MKVKKINKYIYNTKNNNTNDNKVCVGRDLRLLSRSEFFFEKA